MNTKRLMQYKEMTHARMRRPEHLTDFNVETHIRNFNNLPIHVQKRMLRGELRCRYGGNSRVYSLSERLEIYKGRREVLAFFGMTV